MSSADLLRRINTIRESRSQSRARQAAMLAVRDAQVELSALAAWTNKYHGERWLRDCSAAARRCFEFLDRQYFTSKLYFLSVALETVDIPDSLPADVVRGAVLHTLFGVLSTLQQLGEDSLEAREAYGDGGDVYFAGKFGFLYNVTDVYQPYFRAAARHNMLDDWERILGDDQATQLHQDVRVRALCAVGTVRDDLCGALDDARTNNDW